MFEFLEKLKLRKTEVERDESSAWQRLVVALADQKPPDADLTLLELRRLNKTPDDLVRAVELLNQRRVWAAMVAAGSKGEADHATATQAARKEIEAFGRLEEAHDAKLAPLHSMIASAAFAQSEALHARGELARTACCPIALQAVASAEKVLAELRNERAEFERELRAKEDRLAVLRSQNDRDLAGHVDRLRSDIVAMQVQLRSFHERAETLVGDSEAARLQLLRPEAI